jgi:purine nucleoside phosphorylase
VAPSLSNRSKVWFDHPVGARARPVDLVDHDDRVQAQRQRLARDEARLRHRAFDRIDQQQHAVDHRQHALDLAAEVGVSRRVDDVDARAAVLDCAVLGEDGDAALALDVVRVHHALGHLAGGAAKVPDWRSSWSTRVVLPWSTCAMIAMLRMDLRSEVGATRVVSVASVGGIRADLGPGTLLVPHQIIDYTWGRKMTFHEGVESQVTHIDFTDPYDESLRAVLLDAARVAGEKIVDGGVYAATQGPRLETAAEITRFERDGADVVGMTGMPEAALAREAGLPYAAINVVANYAAGRGDSLHRIEFAHIEATLQEAMARVHRILRRICGETA